MKRTKEEALRTKEYILETAFKEFLKNGFEETTIDNIAKVSGNTRGAVYWHFKDKNDIYDHLVEQKDLESLSAFSNIINSNITPFSKIEEIVKLNFPGIKKKTELINFIKMKCELYSYRAKNGDKRNVSGQVFRATVKLLKEARENGEIKKETHPLTAAQTIISLVQGVYMSQAILLKSGFTDSIDINTLKKPVFAYLKSLTSK